MSELRDRLARWLADVEATDEAQVVIRAVEYWRRNRRGDGTVEEQLQLYVDALSETARDIARRAASFADDMKAQQIHVGMGTPPRCVTCGALWPCAASSR